MSIEAIIEALKDDCQKHKRLYEGIGISRIDKISLIDRVRCLNHIDSIVTKLYEYAFFHPECVEKDSLCKEYQWLSNQYKMIASQLVGACPVSKKEIYAAHGYDDSKMKLIKRLWPEHKYAHGPECPDLIFKIRSDYLDNLANTLKIDLNDEVF